MLIDSPSDPPVFVTGYERSGTTLLANIIDRHSSIAVFIESFFIPKYYFTQLLFWPLHLDQNYLRLARAIVEEPASQRNGIQLDQSVVLSAQVRTLASLVDTIFYDWARSRGKERWADKSPGYISKIPILERMFPGARFIHIVRDGRDVWLSLKKLGWQSDVVHVATDWAQTVSKARIYGASMSPERYFEVEYESLVRSPEQEARRVADFLDEPYEPSMIQPDARGPGNPALDGWPKVSQKIDAGNTEKWKNELDQGELAAFDICAGDLLQALGYEVSSTRQYSLPKLLATRMRQVMSRIRRPLRFSRKAIRYIADAARHRLV